jgi:non-specific serine/threonine protein kinase
MLHAAWRDGLVVFGWQGRALDRRAVTSFAAALFLDQDVGWEVEKLRLPAPGRPRPIEVHAVHVPVAVAAQAFLVRRWVPWGTLSPSLSWFTRVARLADGLAADALVVPTLEPGPGGRAAARWRPVVTDGTGQVLAALTAAQPEVVRTLLPGVEPWQVTTAAVEAFSDDAARSRLWDVPVLPIGAGSRSATAVVARRFLGALVSDDPVVTATNDAQRQALAHLTTAVQRWDAAATGRSPLAGLSVSARVVPPTELDVDAASELAGLEPEELPWLVELGLSPSDDPSLVVRAADVWQGDGADLLGTPLEQARSALLLADRRIDRVAPVLAAGLDPERPAEALLPLDDLVLVVRDEAPALEAAGIRVLLPAWWGKRERARVSGTARPVEQPVTSAGLEARGLATVDWRLALGAERLDEAELARLAAAKADLVFVRGRWVAFDPTQVSRALTALTAHRRDRSAVRPLDLVRMGAGTDLDVEVTGEGWAAELLGGLPDDRVTPLDEPPTFRGTLRPYQRRGLGWLAFLGRLGLGGCLADDMGLGKTAQLLALLARERVEDEAPGPTLVVCPLSVMRNWETEAERFTPHLRVVVHHGRDRPRDDETMAGVATDLVITTYATATRDVAVLSSVPWRRVVADEAQHVKNASTAAARAVRRIPAPQKLALTGTPVENRLSELWAILDLVNPGLLGSAKAFRETYAVPIERHHDAEATARLRSLVQPFLLRRSKADRALVPELPPKVEQVAWATLTREQASLYRSVTDVLLDRLDTLEGMDRRGAILAAITRLKQICNHPAHYLGDGSRLEGRSGKLTRFDELVDDALDADSSLLVFTQYKVMGDLLVRHLEHRLGLHVPYLHGGVAKARRDRMVDRFQDGSGGPILLVSLKAGGSGLNLTAASEVVHYDRWWNPAVEDQASDRAWRIGQQRTVLVHKMVCQGTIEERIDRLIAEKRDLAGRVVGAGESWLTELTTAELRDLIVLREAHR